MGTGVGVAVGDGEAGGGVEVVGAGDGAEGDAIGSGISAEVSEPVDDVTATATHVPSRATPNTTAAAVTPRRRILPLRRRVARWAPEGGTLSLA